MWCGSTQGRRSLHPPTCGATRRPVSTFIGFDYITPRNKEGYDAFPGVQRYRGQLGEDLGVDAIFAAGDYNASMISWTLKVGPLVEARRKLFGKRLVEGFMGYKQHVVRFTYPDQRRTLDLIASKVANPRFRWTSLSDPPLLVPNNTTLEHKDHVLEWDYKANSSHQ